MNQTVGSPDGELSNVLSRRYQFLKDGAWLKKHQKLSVSEKIKLLETESDGVKALGLKEFRELMYLPHSKSDFKGKHLVMKKSLVKDIVEMAKDPLQNMADPPDIRNYFGNQN